MSGGAITLNTVITRFGPGGPQPAATDLNSYVKGGQYVANTTGTTGVTSGPYSAANPLKLSSFIGATAGANTTTSYSAPTVNTPLSGTTTVPSGTLSVTIEAWGGGGGGGTGRYRPVACPGCPGCPGSGGGGGSGAYGKLTYSLPTPRSTYWSNPSYFVNYTVGAGGSGSTPGGTSTISSTSIGSFSMTAPGGGQGLLGFGGQGPVGSGGAAGLGGNTNISGNPGCFNTGGLSVTGPGVSSPSGGAGGRGGVSGGRNSPPAPGLPGNSGIVRFTWT